MARRGVNKEQILEAGMSLMYSHGYNAAGIQDIANAAGVPKGSFYNYFKSKEDFVSEVLTMYTDETIKKIHFTCTKMYFNVRNQNFTLGNRNKSS